MHFESRDSPCFLFCRGISWESNAFKIQELLQVVTSCYIFLNSFVTGLNPWDCKDRATVLLLLQSFESLYYILFYYIYTIYKLVLNTLYYFKTLSNIRNNL